MATPFVAKPGQEVIARDGRNGTGLLIVVEQVNGQWSVSLYKKSERQWYKPWADRPQAVQMAKTLWASMSDRNWKI